MDELEAYIETRIKDMKKLRDESMPRSSEYFTYGGCTIGLEEVLKVIKTIKDKDTTL